MLSLLLDMPKPKKYQKSLLQILKEDARKEAKNPTAKSLFYRMQYIPTTDLIESDDKQ